MAERAVKYTADKTSWSKLPQPPRPFDSSRDSFGYLAPGPLRASIIEPSHAGDPFPYHLALPPPVPTQTLGWTAERVAQLPANATSHPWSDWPRAGPCSPSTVPYFSPSIQISFVRSSLFFRGRHANVWRTAKKAGRVTLTQAGSRGSSTL